MHHVDDVYDDEEVEEVEHDEFLDHALEVLEPDHDEQLQLDKKLQLELSELFSSFHCLSFSLFII